VLRIIGWLNKDLASGGQDTVQAIYEGVKEISKDSDFKVLLLVGKSLGNIANTNFRSLLSSILERDVVMVHDIVDAVKIAEPLINSGYDPLVIGYVVPQKHLSLITMSKECRNEGKCFNVKYVGIAQENEYFMIDSKTDMRAYYDFLSDIWIKKLQKELKSCGNIDNKVCLAGYSPIPKVIIKVASALGLNTELIKSLAKFLKMGIEDAIIHAFKTLEETLSRCKRILFTFLSPYMDSSIILYISKD